MIEGPFDIAQANATELIENEEDKLFLESQRKKGRPGCMVGVDMVLLEQQNKKEKEDKLQRRRCCSELEKEIASKKNYAGVQQWKYFRE